MSPSSAQTSVFLVTFVISVISLWWLISKKIKKHYVHVGKVSKLYFFPIKSLKGIEVDSVDCVEKGIQVQGCDDRCYMLISGDGVSISQKQEPRMVLLTPTISENRLHVSGPGMETLVLDLKRSISPNDKIITCKMFLEEAEGIDCGDEASAWFQKFLNRSDVRLVYCAQGLKKRKYLRNNPFYKTLRQKNLASYQNLIPFHLVTQESLDDLNSRLQEVKVSALNFRPNILTEGSKAYDEDKWKFIKFFSGAQISNLLPSGRCLVTTNDPQTGIRSDKEPLVTLRMYRTPTDQTFKAKVGSSPLFGIGCGLLEKGKIAVGDDVFAVVEDKLFNY